MRKNNTMKKILYFALLCCSMVSHASSTSSTKKMKSEEEHTTFMFENPMITLKGYDIIKIDGVNRLLKMKGHDVIYRYQMLVDLASRNNEKALPDILQAAKSKVDSTYDSD